MIETGQMHVASQAAGPVDTPARVLVHGVVHVVDDDASYRAVLGRILHGAGLEPVLHRSALAFLASDDPRGPACVLLDVRTSRSTGLDLQAALRARSRPQPVVFMSGHADIPTTVRAIKEGAIDFLMKPMDPPTLLRSVAAALEHDREDRKRRAHVAGLAARYASLTPKERQVMAGVVAGRLNKQIAHVLESAERTIKTHRARVMAKMDVRSVPDLVHAADALRDRGVAMEPVPGAFMRIPCERRRTILDESCKRQDIAPSTSFDEADAHSRCAPMS